MFEKRIEKEFQSKFKHEFFYENGLEKGRGFSFCLFKILIIIIYLELVYLVTALVPSLTACLANSPGNKRRTPV